jgi:hypothetical protein
MTQEYVEKLRDALTAANKSFEEIHFRWSENNHPAIQAAEVQGCQN